MHDATRARDKALFRYSVIREAADPALSHAERGALVRALAQREHVGPDGRALRIGRSTLDEWIRAWRRGGFEALIDPPRVVPPRISPEVLGLAEALKKEAPERSAVQVRAVIEALGHTPPHERTLERHFARLGLRPPGAATPKPHGRFEASEANELWTGDSLHGPQVKGKKAYLLAFIDDHSRLLTGYRWCAGEDSVRLESALRSGIASRGVPRAILVDRGSAFVASPLLRACAVLGVRLIHASPRAAATKGKIERFFRTVRSQFLVELEARGGARDLAELNSLFSAWVEVVYHRRVHSETKATPLSRFLLAGAPKLPGPELLHEAFLWSEWRTVTKTCEVSLHGNRFEVDAALIGRRVELVFDPFDLTDIEVRFENRPMGHAVAVRVGRHTHPRARPEAAPAAVPTGIDYLGLVAAKRAEELGSAPIGYAALVAHKPSEDEGETP
ncbi:MAG TPA: DDE-type integrase/transposase/recombinase [Solirubrobacteraceae bacterium]|nr:DDE-type integrase/transposase/recombinase [Solirubrobacteraceae bacterium]